MTDKTEEKIAKERAAVEAMRNAKANMTVAISRIETLERALKCAQDALTQCKGYIGASAYTWGDNNRITCHDKINNAVADIAKVLA